MKNLLPFIQMVVSFILIALILLQTSPETSNQRTTLIKPKYTRRGMEKITYISTFVFSFFFIGLAVLQVII